MKEAQIPPQICCANDYCRGNFPGNKQRIQHTCHTCRGRVHPWCMGKEDIGEGLSDGSICAKCNGGEFSTEARNFSGIVAHPPRSLDLRLPPLSAPRAASGPHPSAATGRSSSTASGHPPSAATGRSSSTVSGRPLSAATGHSSSTASGHPPSATTGRSSSTVSGRPLPAATGRSSSTASGRPPSATGASSLPPSAAATGRSSSTASGRPPSATGASGLPPSAASRRSHSKDNKTSRVRLRGSKILAPLSSVCNDTSMIAAHPSWYVKGSIKSTSPNYYVIWEALPVNKEGSSIPEESQSFLEGKLTTFFQDTEDLKKILASAKSAWQVVEKARETARKVSSTRKRPGRRPPTTARSKRMTATPTDDERRQSLNQLRTASLSQDREMNTPQRNLDRYNFMHNFNTSGERAGRQSSRLQSPVQNQDTWDEELQNILEAEQQDHNILPEAFDVEGNLFSNDNAIFDNFRYRFRDEEHEEPFSDLLDEDAIGGDGGIPPEFEEDMFVGNVELKFKFENPEECGYGDFGPEKEQDIRWAPPDQQLVEEIPDNTWDTPLDCWMYTSGFDISYAQSVISTMNEYAHSQIVSGRFAGDIFIQFEVGEYMVFLGILLTISLDGRKAGSYQQYWIETSAHVSVGGGRGRTVPVENHSTWAKEFMKLRRFQQFLKAWRTIVATPESIVDKASHIRRPVQAVNEGAQKTFILGKYVSIDEAGVGSRSRYNPIRQYNKDKPNKFRVDFFSTNCPKKYFTQFLEPYQGKNANNVMTMDQAKHFPTTQKAIVNAVLGSKINNSSDGRRGIACDNRYSSPQLFVYLRDIHKIHAVGTIRKSRKGWDQEIMNLPKAGDRGESLVRFDKVNGLLAGQWRDSKVVAFISTFYEYDKTQVRRRVGRQRDYVPVPQALETYQKYMGGTDRFDQIRECGGGGFAKGIRKFHKWFKTIILAVMDIGLTNSSIAWNMKACTEDGRRKDMIRSPIFRFQTVLAHQLLHYMKDRLERKRNQSVEESNIALCDHTKSPNTFQSLTKAEERKRHQCKVCKLEERSFVQKRKFSTQRGSGSKCGKCLFRCLPCSARRKGPDVYLHHLWKPESSHSKIFQLEPFKNMTSCAEIYHSEEAKGLWNENGNAVTSSPIYQELKNLWSSVPINEAYVGDSDDHS